MLFSCIEPYSFVAGSVKEGITDNQKIADLYNRLCSNPITPEKVEEIKRSSIYEKLMKY